MIDSIIRNVLSDVPQIRIISNGEADAAAGYDVLILSDLADEARSAVDQGAPPLSGIVLLNQSGHTAAVFCRLNKDLNLEQSVPRALEEAIFLAAGER